MKPMLIIVGLAVVAALVVMFRRRMPTAEPVGEEPASTSPLPAVKTLEEKLSVLVYCTS